MALSNLKNLNPKDKEILNKLHGPYLFASDRNYLIKNNVPEDTISRFMRSREALPIDDLIKICKEMYERK